MSYILDALKKSEQQRSGMSLPTQTPALAPQQASATSRFGLPLMLLAVALAAGWFFIRFQQPASHQLPLAKVAESASIKQHHHTPIQDRDHHKIMPSSKAGPAIPVTREQQQAMSAPQAPVSRNRPEVTPVFKPITPVSPVSRAASQLPELPEEVTQPSPAETNIAALSELPVSVQQSMPHINIEGHIYDDNPAGRMVIINGVIRKEKQPIGQNMRLEEITPNGVILSYQGYVFHMGVFEQ